MKQRTSTTLTALITGGLLAASLVALSAAPASADVGSLAAGVAADGAKVVKETVVDARTVDLTISSPAVGTTTTRLLLPKNWAAAPTLRWPTLYMFPGPDKQDYKAWTYYTDIEKVTAGDDVLVVMPSGGPTASYVDEVPILTAKPRKWETYHTKELPQILQRGYRSNGTNAVAGLSAGGFGALSYTFRNPGLYKATAAYSALTDVFDPGAKIAQLNNRVTAGELANPYGPLLLNLPNQVAHNPMSNVAKFRGQPLYISSGRGAPGPLDNADPTYKDQVGGRVIEAATGSMNDRFVAALKLAGATPTVHIYDGGLHYWTYWNREFALSFPMLKAAIGGPTAATVPAAVVPAPKSTGLLGRLFGGLLG